MEYPSFYQEHIQDVISAYRNARSQVTNGASFLFLTDVHIHLNGRASVPLIREIGRQTDVKTVLCGGDFCWAWGSEAECISQLEDTFNYLDPIKEQMRLYLARGNHDATVRNSKEDDRGYTMPYDQVQAYFAAHNSPVDCAGKLYYYVDDPQAKVRYVILDTSEHHEGRDAGWGIQIGMDEEQLCWLRKQALQFEDGKGWSVVVMGHVPCCPELTSASPELKPLRHILAEFRQRTGEFRNCEAELIMYLSGHNHKDRHAIVDGVLHITTGCDAYCRDDNLPRAVGTVDNTLFDLFLVDKDKKTVQVFRIGAGQDRSFSYLP